MSVHGSCTYTLCVSVRCACVCLCVYVCLCKYVVGRVGGRGRCAVECRAGGDRGGRTQTRRQGRGSSHPSPVLLVVVPSPVRCQSGLVLKVWVGGCRWAGETFRGCRSTFFRVSTETIVRGILSSPGRGPRMGEGRVSGPEF